MQYVNKFMHLNACVSFATHCANIIYVNGSY
jgi:hypothetical protein